MRSAGNEQVTSTPSSSGKRLVLGELTNLSNLDSTHNSRKRVVLNELINLPNLESTQNSNFNSTQKPKRPFKRKFEMNTQYDLTQDLEFGTRKGKGKLQKGNEEDIKQESNESLSGLHKCAYSSSIYNHLRSLEMEDMRRPLPNYIEKVQSDISVSMREILVNWLVEVAEEYRLVSDTLYLAIVYVDRFLSSHALARNKLQLLGVCCMLIASKYEEINPPHVEDFCYVTDNTYTTGEVLNMEKEVLKFLNFEMGTPTTKNFLRVFTRATQEDYKKPGLQFEFLCCYLAELSLLDYGCLQYLPSLIAASAIFLSRFMIQPLMHPWNMALQCISGYKPSDLKECVLAIHDLQLNRKGSSLLAVREKYMQHKFKFVASLSSPSEVPARYFEAMDE